MCGVSRIRAYSYGVNEKKAPTATPLELAIWEELAALRGPRRKELTAVELSRRTGISGGTINRLFSPDPSQVRAISVEQVEVLAAVFDLTPAELVRRAERRLKPMSAAADDIQAHRRKKQDEAEAMPPEGIDRREGKSAATTEPEFDSEE